MESFLSVAIRKVCQSDLQREVRGWPGGTLADASPFQSDFSDSGHLF